MPKKKQWRIRGGGRAGARERFFLGAGGKNVDMPSDCQNLGGGHRHIHPLQETKSWGAIAPPPPGLPRPVHIN